MHKPYEVSCGSYSVIGPAPTCARPRVIDPTFELLGPGSLCSEKTENRPWAARRGGTAKEIERIRSTSSHPDEKMSGGINPNNSWLIAQMGMLRSSRVGRQRVSAQRLTRETR